MPACGTIIARPACGAILEPTYCRSMKEPFIRPAGIGDAKTIAAMVAALSRAAGESPPLFSSHICRRDGFGDKPCFRAWIAEVEGRPAGYALHARSYDTDRVIRAEWLCDLYVENWARSRGLGRKLASHVARQAASEGAQAMHWTVLKRNEAARRFYRRFASEDERLLHCEVEGEALARLAAAAPLSDAGIRPARPQDAPRIGQMVSDLLAALGEPVFDFDAGQRILADGFGPDPRFQAIMAERNGEVQGYALFWPIYETDVGGQALFLSDLLVAEKARGAGIARDLMAALARAALAAGYSAMIWEVLEGNARARAFYRKMAREYDTAIVVTCADENFSRLVAESS
jgi:GNAT superfamily N-acetyltransferase